MQAAVDAPALQHAAEAACRAGLRAGLREVDARDLAQEALVRALSSARPPADVPLSAWVYGIARNLGRDHAKSAKAREILVEEAPEAPAGDENLATVLAVRRAVRELPEPLRDVITLHELEEHSLRETAAALEIPFDTAKDRLRRAREQLRHHLGDPDAACAAEHTHSRRRAAAHGAVIVAAVWATLGDRAAVAATSASAAARGFVVRGWVAAIAGGVLAAGGFVAGRLTSSTPDHPAVVAVASPPAAVGPAVLATVDAAVAAPAPASPAPAVPRRAPANDGAAPPATVGTEHDAERLALDRARAALHRGLSDDALVVLMSHARQFPTGELAEERDVLIIEAYVQSGNAELSRRRIERYRSEYPRGALRGRVDAVAAELDAGSGSAPTGEPR